MRGTISESNAIIIDLGKSVGLAMIGSPIPEIKDN